MDRGATWTVAKWKERTAKKTTKKPADGVFYWLEMMSLRRPEPIRGENSGSGRLRFGLHSGGGRRVYRRPSRRPAFLLVHDDVMVRLGRTTNRLRGNGARRSRSVSLSLSLFSSLLRLFYWSEFKSPPRPIRIVRDGGLRVARTKFARHRRLFSHSLSLSLSLSSIDFRGENKNEIFDRTPKTITELFSPHTPPST